jgi:ADP-ribosyl-[dinitrogen reductase] hydrolase
MNVAAESILNGVSMGDAIGGPAAMSRIVSGSVNRRRYLDVDDLVIRYLEWWKTDAFDTGPTFAMVMSRLKNGASVKSAAKEVHFQRGEDSAGCNPVHRIAPIAACMYIPTSKIAAAAREDARITHYHRHAADAAAVVALLCRHLLEGLDLDRACELVSNQEPAAWKVINSAKIGGGGHAPDVVRTALFCLGGDEDPIELATSISGEDNYVGPVVGALIGAATFGRSDSDSSLIRERR